MFDEIQNELANMAQHYPEKDPSDRAYDASRVILSLFPGGGTAAEVLSLVFAPPVVRRRDEWFKYLAGLVDEIRERTKDFDFKTLGRNEQFVSAVIEATRIATSTHHHEKRKLLRNALVKIGTSCNIDEDLQFVYIRLIDDLTPTHIKILDFFWRGSSKIAAMNNGMMPPANQRQEYVDKLLPELRDKRPFLDHILQDLRSHGLCTAQDITSGMVTSVLTNHGGGFLNFILTPEEINQ